MTTADEALVLRELRGSVLVLTLNRPDRLNAWTDALEDEYFAALDDAERDPDVRAIVVTGAGRGFCAGADMEMLQSIDASDADPTGPVRDRARPYRLATPLVGAVNGAAAGIGLVQALYCDVRLTTPEAKWTTAFAQRGLAAEYGSAWLLGRLLGPGRAADLLLSGRVLLGTEAVEIGLAERLVEGPELLDAAVEYADGLARASSPWSMAVMKDQLRHDLGGTFDEAAERAERRMRESFAGPDVAEGVASFLERRSPTFAPLTGPVG